MPSRGWPLDEEWGARVLGCHVHCYRPTVTNSSPTDHALVSCWLAGGGSAWRAGVELKLAGTVGYRSACDGRLPPVGRWPGRAGPDGVLPPERRAHTATPQEVGSAAGEEGAAMAATTPTPAFTQPRRSESSPPSRWWKHYSAAARVASPGR